MTLFYRGDFLGCVITNQSHTLQELYFLATGYDDNLDAFTNADPAAYIDDNGQPAIDWDGIEIQDGNIVAPVARLEIYENNGGMLTLYLIDTNGYCWYCETGFEQFPGSLIERISEINNGVVPGASEAEKREAESSYRAETGCNGPEASKLIYKSDLNECTLYLDNLGDAGIKEFLNK